MIFTHSGLSSVVRKCVDKASGQEYAVKIVDKLGDHGDADIGKFTKNEADILAALSGHKNISKLKFDSLKSRISACLHLALECVQKCTQLHAVTPFSNIFCSNAC